MAVPAANARDASLAGRVVLLPVRLWRTHWIGFVIGAGLIGGGLGHLVRSYYGWENWTGVAIALAAIAVLAIADLGRRMSPARGIRLTWSAVPLLLFGVWYYFETVFGEFNPWAIMFHMQMGMDAGPVVAQYLKDAIPALAGFGLVILGWATLARRDERLRAWDRWLVLALLVANPIFYSIGAIAMSRASTDDRLAAHYVDPAALAAPAGPKRNYIHIYLESAERTYFADEFGDVMGPLAPYEARGLSATDLRQTALTGWSAAGITAANCGVPMVGIGTSNTRYLKFVPEVMPAATCIGDLLARRGYQLTYIMGADLSFAGLGQLFSSHGFDRLIGRDELRQRYGAAASVWGADDEGAFVAALDEVRAYAASGLTFGVSIDTAGGHAPYGEVSASCEADPTIMALEPSILRGVKCTNMLAARFLRQLDEEGLLANAVVVVQSDHLSMRSPVTPRLDRHDRRNLFFAFGPGIEPVRSAKPSSPADIMPTVLDLLGYDLPDGRAALGVSLRAPAPSLVERLGEQAFDEIVRGDTVLGERLWQRREEAGSALLAPAAAADTNMTGI